MRRCGRPSQRVASVTVTVPRNEELTVNYPAIAVSPDGLHLVYVAVTGGVQQLHLRSLIGTKPGTGLQRHHLSTLSSIQTLPEASRMGSASRPGATLNSPSARF